MRDLSPDDERAVERLSFYMLKEAYGAVASVIEKLDPEVARTLFHRIETQIEDALQRIHGEQSEGAASTAIAVAIAETLVPILDESHRHGVAPKPRAKPPAAAAAPVSTLIRARGAQPAKPSAT